MNELVSAVVVLTLVVDPIGNTPMVTALVAGLPAARRPLVIVRECAIAYGLLLVFLFAGQSFLSVLHLSQTSVSIAGGVILFLIAIRMVFGWSQFVAVEGADEPFIVPLATPLIAGPSALAAVMLMASREPGRLAMWAAAVTATMLLTTATLLLGGALMRRLGRQVMQAIERLMGLILTAIAVEMLLSGVRDFARSLTPAG